MSTITSSDRHYQEAGETRNVLVSFVDVLDRDDSIDETISSITSVAATGLTIASSAITTTARKYRPTPGGSVREHVIPAGKGITFKVSGGTNGVTYNVKCTVVTSGSQTLVRYVPIEFSAS